MVKPWGNHAVAVIASMKTSLFLCLALLVAGSANAQIFRSGAVNVAGRGAASRDTRVVEHGSPYIYRHNPFVRIGVSPGGGYTHGFGHAGYRHDYYGRGY